MTRLISQKCTLNPTTDTLFVYSAPLLAIFSFITMIKERARQKERFCFLFVLQKVNPVMAKALLYT